MVSFSSKRYWLGLLWEVRSPIAPRLADKWGELQEAMGGCLGIKAPSPWDSKVGVGTSPAFKGSVALLPSLASVL